MEGMDRNISKNYRKKEIEGDGPFLKYEFGGLSYKANNLFCNHPADYRLF